MFLSCLPVLLAGNLDVLPGQETNLAIVLASDLEKLNQGGCGREIPQESWFCFREWATRRDREAFDASHGLERCTSKPVWVWS